MNRWIRFGRWRFDRDALVVTDGSSTIELEPRVGRLLEVMLARPGDVLSHDSLVELVWDGRPVSDEAVRRAVSALRHAAPGFAGFIGTVHKKGYVSRFPPAVDAAPPQVEAPPSEADAAPSSLADVAPAPDSRHAGAPAAVPRGRNATPLLLGLLVVLAFVLVMTQLGREPQDTPTATAAAAPSPSLAVLPFENASGDPDLLYFSDGISEELLDELARIPALMVTARSSSFRFRDAERDVRDIGRQLGVRYLLEGSVARTDDRVRIDTRLLDASNGFQVWSDHFESDADALPAAQRDIVHAVATQLRVPMARVRRTGAQLDDAAHVEFLKARHLMSSWVTADLERAIGHLQTAIALEPEYAAAHAALSLVLRTIANDRGAEQRAAAARTSLAVVDRALALDPTLGEAHLALAGLADSPEEEERALRRAVALAPNSSIAHEYLAEHLFFRKGAREEGMAMIDRARALDPLRGRAHHIKALMHAFTGEFEATEALLQQALQVEPRFRSALVRIGRLRAERGLYADGVEHVEQALAIDPRSDWGRVVLMGIYTLLGDIEALHSLHRPDTWGSDAQLAIGLGDWRRAVAAIRADAGELAQRGAESSSWVTQVLLAHALHGDDAAADAFALAHARYDDTLPPLEECDNPWLLEGRMNLALLAHLAAPDEGTARAVEDADRAIASMASQWPGFMPYLACGRAMTAAVLGDDERALDLLESAMSGPNGRCSWLVRMHPAFERLAPHPRFVALRAAADAHLQEQRRQLEELRGEGRVPDRSMPALIRSDRDD